MGTATVMSQLAAETLGIPVERVRFEYGDTTLPPTPIAAGSMTAASVGSAVFGVCDALKKKVAEIDGVDPSSINAESYHTILSKHYLNDVEARFDAKPPQEETHATQAFGAHFVEVAIDQDIPVVRVQRMVSAFAGGRILTGMHGADREDAQAGQLLAGTGLVRPAEELVAAAHGQRRYAPLDGGTQPRPQQARSLHTRPASVNANSAS